MDLFAAPVSPLLSQIPTVCLMHASSYLPVRDLTRLLTTNLATLKKLDNKKGEKQSLADLVLKEELTKALGYHGQFKSNMLEDAKEILGDFAGILFTIRFCKFQGLWSWPKVVRGGVMTCFWDSKHFKLSAAVMEPQIGLRTELGTYMDGVTGFSSWGVRC